MKSKQNLSKDLPILFFETPELWEEWLEKNATDSPGAWLRMARKASGLRSMTYAEALDVALCFGWIDSTRKSFDKDSSIQRFTPRGRRSLWSKINREKALGLIEAKRMRPSGMRAIEVAKEDGRWAAAYDSQRNATVPEDLQTELDRNPDARAFFESLNAVNRYAILFRIQTAARAETRAKRVASFIEMLARGQKIYP